MEILNQIAQVVDWNSIAVSNGWIKEAGEAFSNVGYNQLYLSSLITPENLEAVKAAVGEVGSRIFAVNFDFLGLVDLARIPTLKFWTVAGGFALFLLPVVSAGSSLVFSFISMKTNAVNQQAARGEQRQHEVHDDHFPPDFPVDLASPCPPPCACTGLPRTC